MRKNYSNTSNNSQPQDFFTSISFSTLMGQLCQKQKENMITNNSSFTSKDDKALDVNHTHLIRKASLDVKTTLKIKGQFQKIWNSKEDQRLINKIFM